MASSEELEISRSRTLRSRRASAANSEVDFVGLAIVVSVGGAVAIDDCLLCEDGLKVVSIEGRFDGGRESFGKVEDLVSSESGEGCVGAGSSVVAERRRGWLDEPESIEERLGDLRCGVWMNLDSELMRRGSGSDGGPSGIL